MKKQCGYLLLLVAALSVMLTACGGANVATPLTSGPTAAPGNSAPRGDSAWQLEFGMAECALTPTGRNPYFILEPGFQIVLEGGNGTLAITVLEETREVNGVMTRVVEEKEWSNG